MPQFLLDLGIVRDGFRDFQAHGFLIALFQAVGGHFHRSLAATKPCAQLGVIARGAVRKRGFEMSEQFGVSLSLVIAAKTRQSLIEQCQRPVFLEGFFRRVLIHRLKGEPPFGCVKIQRQERPASAALLRPDLVAFIGGKVFQASQQVGAEPAPGWIHSAQKILFDETGEEFLRQILRVVRALPLAS